MLSYEIEVHCICGEIKKYTLNALRSKIVIIGREKENLPKIILHSDDEQHLSRAELYFAFDVNDKDWVVGTGFPLEQYWKYDKRIAKKGEEIKKEKKSKKNSYLIENNNFHNILEQVVTSKLYDNKNIENNDLYKDILIPLQPERPFRLEKLSCVGIFYRLEDKDKLFKYNGNAHIGIKHTLLETIPFHWYIEIKNSRRDTIAVKSYIANSKYQSE
jgi:hypothetical protein